MFKIIRLIGLSVILAGVMVACGGDESQSQATPKPTSTPFPTFAYISPTPPPEFAKTAEVTAETTAEAAAGAGVPTPNPKHIEQGQGRYEALECGTCHGENGEGTDDGSSLIGITLTESEFMDFMLSGGDLGPEHQYSTDRLSANSSKKLYLYLTTLGSE